MKKIVCEMCGGNEFAKADGMFVCQSCGMKYSLEEARGLMAEEKSPEIKREVSADPTEILNNLYVVARRARDDDNSKLAQNYYQKVMEYDPNSWEAYFYCTYFEAMDTNIANISFSVTKLYNCIDSVLGQIKEHVKEEEIDATLQKVVKKTINACECMYKAAYNHCISNASVSGVFSDFEVRCESIRSAYFRLYDCLKIHFQESETFKEYGSRLLVSGLNCVNDLNVVQSDKTYMHYVEEILKLYPEEYATTAFYKQVKAIEEQNEAEKKAAEEKYKHAVKEYPKWRTAFIIACFLIPAMFGIPYFYLAAKADKGEKSKYVGIGVFLFMFGGFAWLGWLVQLVMFTNKKNELKKIIDEYEAKHNVENKVS